MTADHDVFGNIRRLIGRGATTWLVGRRLRGIWVRGALPAGAVVWAANHHSWWDPFVAAAVLAARRRRMALLLSQTNIDRFPIASWIGGFGAAHLRTGLAALENGDVVVCFPEGELRAPGPVGTLADGAGWLATRGGASLVAAGTRVVIRGQQAPEAYIGLRSVRQPENHGGRALTARLAAELTAEVTSLDELVQQHDPRLPLPGFELVVSGRSSIDERSGPLGIGRRG